MECFMGLSGFLGIALIIAIRIIRNKCDECAGLRTEVQQLKLKKDQIPEPEFDIIWNPEGGYKKVPKHMTLCCECGHNYNTAKMTRDREGCYYCPECASNRIQWANWAIKQLKEANERTETVSVERPNEGFTVPGDSRPQGSALGL